MDVVSHVIAHISDLHLGGLVGSRSRFETLVAYLRECVPGIDAVVVTGDLSDHGDADDYRLMTETLDIGVPIVAVPGNHDDRASMRAAIPALGGVGSEPIHQVALLDGLAIVGCDVTVPGEPYGNVDDALLSWLDSTLQAVIGTPTVVCMHHHPVASRIGWLDGIALRGADRLEDVLRSHGHVAAVLAGHLHSAMAATFAGRPLIVAPGSSTVVVLPWEPYVGSMHTLMPAGVAFHVVTGTDVVTHFRTAPSGVASG